MLQCNKKRVGNTPEPAFGGPDEHDCVRRAYVLHTCFCEEFASKIKGSPLLDESVRAGRSPLSRTDPVCRQAVRTC
jgi:hypothetical protein